MLNLLFGAIWVVIGIKIGAKAGPTGLRAQAPVTDPVRPWQQQQAGSSAPAPATENLTRSDFVSMMSEAMNAQFPKLILETTKVVTAQLQSDNMESSRSFTSYSQDLKQLNLRTEEVEAKAKTAALKSEGGYSRMQIRTN